MAAYCMSKQHADLLIRNRVFLVKNIKISATLLSELSQERIVTSDMSEEIVSILHPTSRDKVAALLDLLPKRGPKAFSVFIRALIETDHDHVALHLDKNLATTFIHERKVSEERGMDAEVAGQNLGPDPTAMPPLEMEKTSEELPQEILEESLMKIQLEPVNLKDEWTKQLTQSQGCYQMKKAKRGLALIICNEYFISNGLSTRDGANFDTINIQILLQNLNFETREHQNVTAEELEKILIQESANPIHREANAFICFIMSHGTQGYVYCTDGQKLSIADSIASKFDGKNCPALINKPKLFFIQACQGSAVTAGQNQDMTDARSPMSSLEDQTNQQQIEKSMAELRIQDTGDAVPAFSRSDHEKSDFLFAYATVPGYKAWRHSELGSWFVRTIVYVFSKYSHREHSTELLTRVRQLMSKMRTMHTDESFMQITETRDTLLKKLYFFPGFVE